MRSPGARVPLPALLLGAVLAIALLTRLGALGNLIMFDDAASWVFATLPWEAFVRTLREFEGNMSAFYLALRGMLLFGDSEVVLRSLSVACGVGTVAVVWAIGTQVWNRGAGLVAAALLAVHVIHVDSSQQARGYAAALFLVSLSTLLLIRARRSGAASTWTAYVVTAALSCYAQVLSVLVLAAQWLWLLLDEGWRTTLRRWLPACALALGVAPILLYVVTHDRGQIDWVPDFNRYRFMATSLQFAGGGYGYAALLLACIGYGCFDAWRFRRENLPGVMLALTWLLLPGGLLVVKSALGKSMYVDRYLLGCLPPLLLLVGLGVESLWRGAGIRRVAGAAALGLIAATLVTSTVARYRVLKVADNPYREFATQLTTEHKPGDGAIYFTSQTLFSFQYYAARAGRELPTTIFPDFQGTPTGEQRNPATQPLRDALRRYDRVWVILNNSGIRLVRGAAAGKRAMDEALAPDFRVSESRTRDFLTLELHERQGSIPAP